MGEPFTCEKAVETEWRGSYAMSSELCSAYPRSVVMATVIMVILRRVVLIMMVMLLTI